ncbi:Zinc finger protein dzip1 [Rhizophlyctis rosea]|nr:Zinc finger protein dzip1 [Rhizophlyctis rosea]
MPACETCQLHHHHHRHTSPTPYDGPLPTTARTPSPRRDRDRGLLDGFYFKRRRERLNWRVIGGVSVERIVKDVSFCRREVWVDIMALQDTMENITFCDIEAEDMRCADPNFIKLFQLAQLMIEYLLHSQDYLADTNKCLTDDNMQLKHQLDALCLTTDKQTIELASLKKEARAMRKTLYAYQLMTKIPGADAPDMSVMADALDRFTQRLMESEKQMRADMEEKLRKEVEGKQKALDEAYRQEKLRYEKEIMDLKSALHRELDEERKVLEEERKNITALLEQARKTKDRFGNLEDETPPHPPTPAPTDDTRLLALQSEIDALKNAHLFDRKRLDEANEAMTLLARALEDERRKGADREREVEQLERRSEMGWEQERREREEMERKFREWQREEKERGVWEREKERKKEVAVVKVKQQEPVLAPSPKAVTPTPKETAIEQPPEPPIDEWEHVLELLSEHTQTPLPNIKSLYPHPHSTNRIPTHRTAFARQLEATLHQKGIDSKSIINHPDRAQLLESARKEMEEEREGRGDVFMKMRELVEEEVEEVVRGREKEGRRKGGDGRVEGKRVESGKERKRSLSEGMQIGRGSVGGRSSVGGRTSVSIRSGRSSPVKAHPPLIRPPPIITKPPPPKAKSAMSSPTRQRSPTKPPTVIKTTTTKTHRRATSTSSSPEAPTPAIGGWKFPSLRRRARAPSNASSVVDWAESATEYSGSDDERDSMMDTPASSVPASPTKKKKEGRGREDERERERERSVGAEGGEKFKKTFGNIFGRRSRNASASRGEEPPLHVTTTQPALPMGPPPQPPAVQTNVTPRGGKVVTDSEVEYTTEESYTEDESGVLPDVGKTRVGGGGGLTQVVRQTQYQRTHVEQQQPQQPQQRPQDVASPGGLAAAVAKLTQSSSGGLGAGISSGSGGRGSGSPPLSAGPSQMFRSHSIGTIGEESEEGSSRQRGVSRGWEEEEDESTEERRAGGLVRALGGGMRPQHQQQQQQTKAQQQQQQQTKPHTFAPPPQQSGQTQDLSTLDISEPSDLESDDSFGEDLIPIPTSTTKPVQQQQRAQPTQPSPQPKAPPQQQQRSAFTEDDSSIALSDFSDVSDVEDVPANKPKAAVKATPQQQQQHQQQKTGVKVQQGKNQTATDTVSDLSGILDEFSDDDEESEPKPLAKGKGLTGDGVGGMAAGGVRGFASQAPKTSIVPRRFEEEEGASDSSEWD